MTRIRTRKDTKKSVVSHFKRVEDGDEYSHIMTNKIPRKFSGYEKGTKKAKARVRIKRKTHRLGLAGREFYVFHRRFDLERVRDRHKEV